MARDDISIHMLRKIVIDWLLICGLFVCTVAMNVLWSPFHRGFFCGDESIMFPYKQDTVSTPVLRATSIGISPVFFLICEWALLRNVIDDRHIFGVRIPAWLRGFYCTVTSFVFGLFFLELTVNLGKNIIGRNRPHFYDVCQPSINCSSPEWQHRYVQPADFQCTGPSSAFLQEDMRKSFPSGHSALSAFAAVYLALYLQYRFTWRGTKNVRRTLQFVILMLSWCTALSRVSDFKHHWSDVLAGYSIGIVFGVIMWQWGTNLVRKKEDHAVLSQHQAVSMQPRLSITPQSA